VEKKLTSDPRRDAPAQVGKLASFLARAVATAGGAGYSPIAPGTCGTLVAVPIAWLCRGMNDGVFLALCAAVTLAGIAAAHVADQVWGTHDAGRIVIDEVAGYLVTVALVDRSQRWVLIIGFVLFRALDIIKPPPIRWVERTVPGGSGVVLDDVAAGIVGAVVMVVLARTGVLAALPPL
jgi:phosphatidylglycerophosphatase A